MHSSTNEKENKTKYSLFLDDIKDENNFTKKIDVLYDIQYMELFSKILIMSRVDFTKKITSNISYILSEEYDPQIRDNAQYILILYKCIQKYNKKYNDVINYLIEAYEKHEINIQLKNAESDYITTFRKHCSKTGEYALHKCHKNRDDKGKFIPVYMNKVIKYVICNLCRKTYASNKFKNYCENCKQIYYCNLLSKEENPNLLPATWDPPHCETIINKNIYCNKCKNLLYLNLTNNQLQCINRKCKNIVEPNKIQWTCPTCNDLFRSNAKVFNPSEVEHCKYLIKKALILKQRAHPYKIPCCKDIELSNTEFCHSKNCSGTLYFVQSNKKLIVVCKKCRAINWFSNFIWTCPKCLTRFRDVNSDRNEEIIKKSKCFEIQNLNKETKKDEVTYRRRTRLFNLEKSNTDNSLSLKTLTLRRNDNISGKYNSSNDNKNGIFKNNYDVEKNKKPEVSYIKINKNINKDNISEKSTKSRGKYIFDRTIGRQLKPQKSEYLTLRIKEDNFKGDKSSIFTNTLESPTQITNQKKYNKYNYKNNLFGKNEEPNGIIKSNLAQDNLKNYYSTSNINDTKNGENHDEKATESNNKRVIILRNHLRSKQKLRQEVLSSEKPDDVVNASMINTKLDIKIDNDTIKKNTLLYEQIQRKLKKILSKGKLPVFNIDNYVIGKQIGDGSFGTIFEATNNKTQMKYALKKIVTCDINNLEKYQKEFEIVHQSTHPNILDIHGICFRCFDQTTFIIYVLMDLAKYDWEVEINYKKKENNDYYSEKQLIYILKQLSSALLFLQKDKSISHRDIKPENILVFKNDIYKLSDFGEADNDAKTDDRQKTLRGTELYMSPLLHQGLMSDADYIIHNTFKSDVFSLGCCLVIAASLDFEVIGEIRKLQKLYSIKNYLIKLFNKRYSNKFIELLLKMINFNEKERFDFIQLDDYLKKSFQD